MTNRSASPVSCQMHHQLVRYLEERLDETESIPKERQSTLVTVAQYVREKREQGESAKLMFVCTHNSRRSQFSQVWAHVAAQYFGRNHVESYSAGTEVTAFHPNAVQALQRAGLRISVDGTNTSNPVYHLETSAAYPALSCFSKLVTSPSNPRSHFCALMTCSQADEACPVIAGFERRIPLLYEDPKVSDGTPQMPETYDATSRLICREMLFIMGQATT